MSWTDARTILFGRPQNPASNSESGKFRFLSVKNRTASGKGLEEGRDDAGQGQGREQREEEDWENHIKK